MASNKTVWLISLIILLVCIAIAAVIYVYTGNVILVLFIAPPIIHWILKRRSGN